jgi:hypothetical protein
VATGGVVLVLGLAIFLVVGTSGSGHHPTGSSDLNHSRAATAKNAGGSDLPKRASHAKLSSLTPTWTGDGQPVTLAFGGDIHFEGVLGQRLAHDPANALDGSVATLLPGADLSMTNFESALTEGTCPDPQPKTHFFQAPPSAITAFRSAGITLVTEANNHGEDCGRTGLGQSLSVAHAANYPVIGIGQNAAQAFAP